MKFKGLVSTEGSSAFNAYGFDAHQPLRAIYCLVNLEAIAFSLLNQLMYKKGYLLRFIIIGRNVSWDVYIFGAPMWNILFRQTNWN